MQATSCAGWFHHSPNVLLALLSSTAYSSSIVPTFNCDRLFCTPAFLLPTDQVLFSPLRSTSSRICPTRSGSLKIASRRACMEWLQAESQEGLKTCGWHCLAHPSARFAKKSLRTTPITFAHNHIYFVKPAQQLQPLSLTLQAPLPQLLNLSHLETRQSLSINKNRRSLLKEVKGEERNRRKRMSLRAGRDKTSALG